MTPQYSTTLWDRWPGGGRLGQLDRTGRIPLRYYNYEAKTAAMDS